MSSPSPLSDELNLPLLGHDLQTTLAAISGHAQLLQRHLRRRSLPASELDRHVARLDGMIELVMRASGLVALLQTGAGQSAGADPGAGTAPDELSAAPRRSPPGGMATAGDWARLIGAPVYDAAGEKKGGDGARGRCRCPRCGAWACRRHRR